MQSEQTFLFIKLGGRNAIPVRALPYVTRGRLSPYDVASQLAGKVSDTHSILKGVTTYQLRRGSFIQQTEQDWREISDRFADRERMKGACDMSTSTYRAAIDRLPPGVFVWADDVFSWKTEEERRHIQSFTPWCKLGEVECAGSLNQSELTHSAAVSDTTFAVLFEKFGVHNEAPQLSVEVDELLALWRERDLNGKFLDWHYWLQQMPKLTSKEASRLMCGLDPDLFRDLAARLTENDPMSAVGAARDIQRLAETYGMHSATPGEWLAWADEKGWPVHATYRLNVDSSVAPQSSTTAEATPTSVPIPSQAVSRGEPPGESAKRDDGTWNVELLQKERDALEKSGSRSPTKDLADKYLVSGARIREVLGKAPMGNGAVTKTRQNVELHDPFNRCSKK